MKCYERGVVLIITLSILQFNAIDAFISYHLYNKLCFHNDFQSRKQHRSCSFVIESKKSKKSESGSIEQIGCGPKLNSRKDLAAIALSLGIVANLAFIQPSLSLGFEHATFPGKKIIGISILCIKYLIFSNIYIAFIHRSTIDDKS